MWYRLLIFTFFIPVGFAALSGALGLSSVPPIPTLPLPPNVPNAAAEQTLDRAIAAMDPARLGYVETKLWQKVTLPSLTYEAHGRYFMGPNQHFRLELRTRQGAMKAARLTVSDGRTLWDAERIGNTATATKLDLKQVTASLDGEGLAALLRTEFMQGPRFGGVMPLLRNLRGRMNWVKLEKIEQGGKARWRLTGVWTADFAAYITAQEPWPAGLPEQCRLDLDPVTLWPHRVEWWGPVADGAPDTLLAQVEYRDPVVYANLPPERAAKEFTFDPGTTPIQDQTEAVKTQYEARLKAKAGALHPRPLSE